MSNTQNIYIISGEETLLVEEALEKIRRDVNTNERESYLADRFFDLDKLQASLQTASLFSEHSLIELRIPDNQPIPEKLKSYLLQYANHPNPEKTLVIIHYFDSKTQKAKWFKTLLAHCAFIPVRKVSANQLPAWINDRLTQYKMSIEPNAIRLIAEQVEGNLLAAKQTIEKLYLDYGNKKTLTAEDAAEAISNHAKYNVFELAASALQGKPRKTLTILQSLREEGTEPTLILWALTREIRTLFKILHQQKNGISFDEACTNCAVWSSQKPQVKAGLKKHSFKTLADLLQQAAEADRTIKGAAQGDIWELFKQLCLDFCVP